MNDCDSQKLICAVECLARSAARAVSHLEDLLHFQQPGMDRVTKQDLKEMEARILEAIRKTKDAEIKSEVDRLKQSSDALGEAVAENQPK